MGDPPKTGMACPSEMQLVLITKDMMDVQFSVVVVGSNPLLRPFQRCLFVGISLPWGVAEKPRLDGKPE